MLAAGRKSSMVFSKSKNVSFFEKINGFPTSSLDSIDVSRQPCGLGADSGSQEMVWFAGDIKYTDPL